MIITCILILLTSVRIESSAVKISNAVQFITILHTALRLQQQNNRHPIPRPNGQAMSVSCENIGEKWPRYDGTVLYFAYRNLLVAGSCYKSGDTLSYSGNLAISEEGTTCLSWTSTINEHYDSEFPDGSVAAASNFCRNPDGLFRRPYCYVGVDGTVELCNVALCASDGQ